MTPFNPLKSFFKFSTRIAIPLVTGVLMMTEQNAAAAESTGGIRNIVLVHGAWADGSSWAKIIPTLQAKGLNVVAVQNPLTSLADDVAATKRAIALMDGPVLLIGHSYGGAVITQAGADPKVAGLVYVAAFAPDEGQVVGELGKDMPPPAGVGEIRPDSQGLACKNAILIVEFAKDLEDAGQSLLPAIVHAGRMRLRPILMTSIAFCAGVLPLIFGSGAGSEMRQAMGIAVFSGMLGVTLFGIFLTPVFYVLLRIHRARRLGRIGDADLDAPDSQPLAIPEGDHA